MLLVDFPEAVVFKVDELKLLKKISNRNGEREGGESDRRERGGNEIDIRIL